MSGSLPPETFWVEMTPAKAFLVRVFGGHCKMKFKVRPL